MFKKILSVLFSIGLMFSAIIDCRGVDMQKISTKKAIIISPGIYASGLFYRNETCAKYHKNEAIWMPLDNTNKWRMVKGVAKFKFFHSDLYCDENGKPVNDTIGLPLENEDFPNSVDKDVAKYGVGNSCKKLMDILTKQFPDYKVIMYNYDWRLDVDKAAKGLTEEVQRYDEVILIGYSLGGIVACRSAALLNKLGDLSKIKKYISIAVPYNGTVEALYVLNKGMRTENDFMGKAIEILGIPNIIKNMAKNCSAAYQMLPSKDYFKRAKNGYITDMDNHTLSYDETLEFLKKCDFSKKSDGTTKKFLDKPQKIYDDLIVNGKHILTYLDYHIIAGCGLDTMSELKINSQKPGDIVIKNYVDGDGSIALNESAIPFDSIDSDRIYKVKGRHQFLLGYDSVIENIEKIIKNGVFRVNQRSDLAA